MKRIMMIVVMATLMVSVYCIDLQNLPKNHSEAIVWLEENNFVYFEKKYIGTIFDMPTIVVLNELLFGITVSNDIPNLVAMRNILLILEKELVPFEIGDDTSFYKNGKGRLIVFTLIDCRPSIGFIFESE